MKRSLALAFFVCFGLSVGMVNLAFSLVLAAESPSSKQDKGYSGTTSCRECHEKFYKLWSPSRHAKAMQPFSVELAQSRLTPQTQETFVGKHSYRADLTSGVVRERGPEGDKEYSIAYVLGGKNKAESQIDDPNREPKTNEKGQRQ